MSRFEFVWKTEDSLEIYAQGWKPGIEPRAAVCLVHGLGEHSGRYSHLAGFLDEKGFALLTFDLRGHGKSGGKRGHTHGYESLMNDISHLLQEAEKRFPGCPKFLYGHSVGGNLVINYALRRSPGLNGVIASAPLLRTAFEQPPWKMVLGRIMRRLWPSFSTSNGLNIAYLSRDPEVGKAYRDDPLVHDRVTVCFIDIQDAGLWALEHAAEFSLPLLVMHGDADRITSPQASREFAAGAGEGCTLKVWSGLYHEIHNEPGKEKVISYLMEWLSARL